MRIAILTTDSREHYGDYTNPNPYFGTAPEALLQGFARLPDVEVHVISCVRQPVNSPEKIAPNIFYHSLVVPKFGWLRTAYQGCIRAVRKKLQAIQPDVVHGQGTERDCALTAVFSGFPNVLTIHGNMRLIARVNKVRPFSYNWLAARLEGFVLPRTGGVVCITNHTRQAVGSLAQKTWVLPNAVDKSFFEVDAVPDSTARPIGLCIGTVCFHKNQNDLIRALDPLAKTENFRILFLGQAGNGDYGVEFQQLIKARAWCEFAGWAGRKELKDRFRTASFLILPTREDNCPMVVLEAMATGVPVVASNVGGVPDLIQPEKTGLLCDPYRPESFAEGVRRILSDKALRDRLAAAAKIHAKTHFHPEIIARRHVEIYREVLSET